MLPLASLICGFLFGTGLLVSGMVSPAKVLAFLDVLGDWDPSLAVVMVAALTVTAVGFRVAERRGSSFIGQQCEWPSRRSIDKRLVVGAMVFGAGWGSVGLCPGPAIENLATGSPQVLVFVAAMVTGMVLHDLWQRYFTEPNSARGTEILRADG